MIDEILQMVLEEAKDNMDKSIGHLSQELHAIRAGRATPSMLETVRVDYYGTHTPLNQMASVSAPAHDLLVVQPWDKSVLALVEKAIIAANLGLNPANDGVIIRVPVPPLSEERRKDLVKAARARGEDTKIAIRNIRRSVREEIKKAVKEDNLPEDMQYEAEKQLQEMTDAYIDRIDKGLDRKEEEIMEV